MAAILSAKKLRLTAIAMLLFLLLLLSLNIFRHPIAVKSIEYITQSHGIRLTCLDFSVDWSFTIHIRQACIDAPMGSIELQNGHWQPWLNKVQIDTLSLGHKKVESLQDNSAPSTETEQLTHLSLPNYFPHLTIDALHVDSYLLSQPILISLFQTNKRTWRIAGDLHGNINMQDAPITGKLNWGIAHLTKWLPFAKQLRTDFVEHWLSLDLDSLQVMSTFSFDGQHFTLNNTLNHQGQFQIPKCVMDLTIAGQIHVDLDIHLPNVQIDLRQLNTQLGMQDCTLASDYFHKKSMSALAVTFPSTIALSPARLAIPGVQVTDVQYPQRGVQLHGIHYQLAGNLALQGKLTTGQMGFGTGSVANISSTFSLNGKSHEALTLHLDSHLNKIQFADISLSDTHNIMDAQVTGLNKLQFSGKTRISDAKILNFSFLPILIEHTGQGQRDRQTISSQHQIAAEQSLSLSLIQHQQSAKLTIAQQSLHPLQGLISQFDNSARITEGELSAQIQLTIPWQQTPFSAKGRTDIQDLSLAYQDYQLNGLALSSPFKLDSAGLHITGASINADLLNVGVPLERLKAKVFATDTVFSVNQVQGDIFSGQFELGELWLDKRPQRINLRVKDIDLAQVVALQEQQGISVTGTIEGDLPLIVDKQGVRIEDGWLSSMDGGRLVIENNPSFNEIKHQQPQLALLENLDFSQLETKVSLAPDGEMLFKFAINGKNPNLNQQVNFNYSHQENIFSLLESIRLVDQVEHQIEQKIKQGDQK